MIYECQLWGGWWMREVMAPTLSGGSWIFRSTFISWRKFPVGQRPRMSWLERWTLWAAPLSPLWGCLRQSFSRAWQKCPSQQGKDLDRKSQCVPSGVQVCVCSGGRNQLMPKWRIHWFGECCLKFSNDLRKLGYIWSTSVRKNCKTFKALTVQFLWPWKWRTKECSRATCLLGWEACLALPVLPSCIPGKRLWPKVLMSLSTVPAGFVWFASMSTFVQKAIHALWRWWFRWFRAPLITEYSDVRDTI